MNLDPAVDALINVLRAFSDGDTSDEEELRKQATQLVVMMGQAMLASTALVTSMAENTTHFEAVAKVVHNQYIALKKEGFSPAQALDLCRGMVSGLTAPSK